jgi:hypothetical protein
MKRYLVAIAFLLFGTNGYCERFVVTGTPIKLEEQPGYYTFPKSYNPRKPYHYINILNRNRVCFLKEHPQFAKLDKVDILIAEENKKLIWICYAYSSKYFERDY